MSATVGEEQDGMRLDVVVAKVAGVPRTKAGALVDDGLVTVNGTVQRKAYRVSAGDSIDLEARATPAPAVAPSGVDVVHDDDALVVVSKPSGVVVHAARTTRDGTLVDALLAKGIPLAPRGGEGRPGIVHRLDRDVSGLLVVAKTDEAHERLVAAMKERTIERRYLALVIGTPPSDTGKIDAPVGRHPRHRTRMAVVPEGKPAVTWFAIRERFPDCSLLDLKLESGRTHQIRVHVASIGHPIVGDTTYGRDPAFAERIGLRRPFLHAYQLSFEHPMTGAALSFSSPLPPALEDVLGSLR